MFEDIMHLLFGISLLLIIPGVILQNDFLVYPFIVSTLIFILYYFVPFMFGLLVISYFVFIADPISNIIKRIK